MRGFRLSDGCFVTAARVLGHEWRFVVTSAQGRVVSDIGGRVRFNAPTDRQLSSAYARAAEISGLAALVGGES